MKTSIELKAELEELDRLRDTLATEAKELEQRLAEVRNAIVNISGTRDRSGLIARKRIEIEQAESREKDESAPLPTWIEPPPTGDNFVISRITKKRIFLKQTGCSEIQFSIEAGIPVYEYDRYRYNYAKLDVAVTIDTWNAHIESTK